MFDNLFNTVINVQGKTNDTTRSWEELNDYCYQPELKCDETTGRYPEACYTLDKFEKKVLLNGEKNSNFLMDTFQI